MEKVKGTKGGFMSSEKIVTAIESLLCEHGNLRTRSFESGGVLTNNVGFTLYLKNGSEYQVTVVQSKHGHAENEDDDKCLFCEEELCFCNCE